MWGVFLNANDINLFLMTFPCMSRHYRALGSRVGAVMRALASHQCVLGSIPGSGVIGEQGWRSGDRARLPPMRPGFDSRT